jgi:hypothetical protein
VKTPWPLLLLLAALPCLATAERPLKATLTEATGDVKVSQKEGSPWEPAEPGLTLAAGARIKTGPDGNADLLFEDGTALRLEANASAGVAAAAEKDGERSFSIRLWAGRLLSQVMRRERPVRYEVRTPVAAAAVRGTEFVADASDGTAGLAVFEGAVEAQSLQDDKPLGQPVALAADQELSLDRGRPAGPPRRISGAMAEYRRSAATLFRARIAAYRADGERVRALQKAFMERRAGRMQNRMRDQRRRMRRRMAPSPH